MLITHCISRDRFTSGYINFFKTRMMDNKYLFIVSNNRAEKYPLKLADQDDVVFVENCKTIRFQKKVTEAFDKSDIIIFSGLFEWRTGFSLLPVKYLKKTYLHFWGGDFYFLKNKPLTMKEKYLRALYLRAIRNVLGCVFLIDGEYEKFKEITHITSKHYVAPMPPDPLQYYGQRQYLIKCRNKHRNDDFINILVGNSATRSNHTEDVLVKLKNISGIRIYCPLSYGEDAYRNEIIKIGKETFGDCFVPLVDMMKEEDYMEFLSGMDVGIFNNDRQQAMGNINLLLALGKKVFLRSNTSMWEIYKKRGYHLFSVDELDNTSAFDIVFFDDEKRNKNMEIDDDTEWVKNAADAWNIVIKTQNYETLR